MRDPVPRRGRARAPTLVPAATDTFMQSLRNLVLPVEDIPADEPACAEKEAARVLRRMIMAASADIDPLFTSKLYALLSREEFTEVAFELMLATASGRTTMSNTAIGALRPLVATAQVPAALLAGLRAHDRPAPRTRIVARTSGSGDVDGTALDAAAVVTAITVTPARKLWAGRRVTTHSGADLGPAYLVDFAADTPERTLAEGVHRLCATLCTRTYLNFSLGGRLEGEQPCPYQQDLVMVGDVLWTRC